MNNITCPICLGIGKVPGHWYNTTPAVENPYGLTPINWKGPFDQVTCRTCNGEGKVPIDYPHHFEEEEECK
jgi:hypothetical protein